MTDEQLFTDMHWSNEPTCCFTSSKDKDIIFSTCIFTTIGFSDVVFVFSASKIRHWIDSKLHFSKHFPRQKNAFLYFSNFTYTGLSYSAFCVIEGGGSFMVSLVDMKASESGFKCHRVHFVKWDHVCWAKDENTLYLAFSVRLHTILKMLGEKKNHEK